VKISYPKKISIFHVLLYRKIKFMSKITKKLLTIPLFSIKYYYYFSLSLSLF